MVVDASMTAVWCFPEERTPSVIAVRDRVSLASMVVPAHFHVEVANVLLVAERRKRLTPAQRTGALTLLAVLPVEVDPETWKHAFGATTELAVAHRLTLYDAAYLELAMRRRLPIATLDKDLANAARAVGLESLGL